MPRKWREREARKTEIAKNYEKDRRNWRLLIENVMKKSERKKDSGNHDKLILDNKDAKKNNNKMIS